MSCNDFNVHHPLLILGGFSVLSFQHRLFSGDCLPSWGIWTLSVAACFMQKEYKSKYSIGFCSILPERRDELLIIRWFDTCRGKEMSFEVRQHTIYNINTSYILMQTTIMTSEVLFITDICIHIKMWSSLFVDKHKIVFKELHCSVRHHVYLLEA